MKLFFSKSLRMVERLASLVLSKATTTRRASLKTEARERKDHEAERSIARETQAAIVEHEVNRGSSVRAHLYLKNTLNLNLAGLRVDAELGQPDAARLFCSLDEFLFQQLGDLFF